MGDNKQKSSATIDRIYVLDGGEAHVADISQWSSGLNIGKPSRFSSNSYLIQHGNDWMIWNTGFDDDLVATPEGVEGQHGVRGVVTRTIAAQFEQIGVTPTEIAHFDHVGNSRLFPHTTFYIQRAEWDAMFDPESHTDGFVPHLYRTMRPNPVLLLKEDYNVFHDGSVRIIATPGHTSGHQSLLVRLPHYGPVILSGDIAHFMDNYTHRRVPKFNADAQRTRASMEKIDRMARAENAKLWINHDIDQSLTLPYAPELIY